MHPDILIVLLNKRVELETELVQFHSQLVAQEFQKQVFGYIIAEYQCCIKISYQIVNECSHVVETLKVLQLKIGVLEKLCNY